MRQAKAGTGQQIFIADQISTGATSFLTTEYTYLAPFVVACAVFIVSVLEGQKAGSSTWHSTCVFGSTEGARSFTHV